MNPDTILDAQDQEELEVPYHLALRWWEQRRWIYNLILIVTISLTLGYFWAGVLFFGMIEASVWSLLYLIAANVLYSIGWGLEIICGYYFKNTSYLQKSRWLLFVSGSVFSILTTIFLFVGDASVLS